MISVTAPQILPGFVRTQGDVSVRFASRGGATFAAETGESGGFRIRFPRSPGGCEGTLINTAGGLTGGDRLRTTLRLEPATTAVITTPAAEKIYRSSGEATAVETRLSLGAGARLDWVPQETILFSGARLRRALSADLEGCASLLVAEAVIFGRTAMGEEMRAGELCERWRIRRAGTLVFADNTRLAGDIADTLSRPAVGHGARAIATIVLVAPDAPMWLEGVRACAQDRDCDAGASAWNGLLVTRLVGRDARTLRDTLCDIICLLRGGPLPRAFNC